MAIVMPAHNESAGILGFLTEIADEVAGRAQEITIIVIDDRSTDGTAEVVQHAGLEAVRLVVLSNEKNLGHGPTAMRAYREGLASAADLIVHVDGDGQFEGSDFPALIRAAETHDAVRGVRRGRSDPWYRRLLTFAVSGAVRALARRPVIDANTPLRAYRRETLEHLVTVLPPGAQVPHIHFSILESRWRLRVADVEVTSLPRRGGETQGTMWGAGGVSRLVPPRRLRRFMIAALREVWTYRGLYKQPAPAIAEVPER